MRRRLVSYLVLAAIVALLAGGGFAAFESHQVSNFGEGVWWALSLMSTVGFVGEPPESVVGRVLSSILMVSGFALMALVTAAVASLFVSEDQEPEEQSEALFEAQTLRLLEDVHRRLEVIESDLRPSPTPAPGVTEPPPPASS
ncbi:MAG: potassium channel family protein [Intrasporangiaceae bacterium]|nr:potassium channel family protein [Intrasporangiaceae bacterium]